MSARKNNSVGILIEGNAGTLREARETIIAILKERSAGHSDATMQEAMRALSVIAKAPDSYSISGCTVWGPKS